MVNLSEETLLEEQGEAFWDRAKTRGTEAVEDTMDFVRHHPGKSMAVVALAGAAAGALMLSRFYSEPETFSNRLGSFSLDKWSKVRQGIIETLVVSRDVLDALLKKMN